MNTKDKMHRTSLAKLLDKLMVRSNKLKSVTESLEQLTDYDLLILAGWDTATTFGPSFGRLNVSPPCAIEVADTWGRILITASVEGTKDSMMSRRLIVMYEDVDIAVVVDEDSPLIPNARATHKVSVLVVAMQLIRDYVDSTLLKPPHMRSADFSRFAAVCGISDEYFTRLSSWFPTVVDYLQKDL